MKQIIASFLLLIFLYPAVSTYVHYQGGKHRYAKEFKRKMVRGIAKEACIKIEWNDESESNPNLEWHNHHEFRLNGIMYDIVSKVKTSKGIIYYVIQDIAESKFIAQIEKELIDALSHDPGVKKNTNQCYSYFHQLFYNGELEQVYKVLYSQESIKHFASNDLNCDSEVHLIPLPPPEYFS